MPDELPTDVRVCVVSSGRPGNVPAMAELFAPLPLWWYVPADQAGDYRYTGAEQVVPVAYPDGQRPLVWQRNQALDDGFAADQWVAMTDDDLRRCAVTDPDGTNTKAPIPAAAAVELAMTALFATPYRLAGAAPTDNAYFCRREVTTDGFIRSGFTVHRPNPLRYDPELPLKEDYDLTLQHLRQYGGAVRVDALLMTYQQRSNRGGVQDYRTPEAEAAACRLLLARWPDHLRAHATRANELTLRWKP